MTYHAKVIAGGKMVIPAELRRELGIRNGDSLIVSRDEHGAIVLRTVEQVAAEVRQAFHDMRGSDSGDSVVDELLAERRKEARRERARIQATAHP